MTLIIIIILLVLGAMLMFREPFLRGLVTGIIGLLCWVAAVLLGYRDFGFHGGNLILGGEVVGLVIGAFCWFKSFPERRMAGLFPSLRTVCQLKVAKPDLLHRSGVAVTQLRPCGSAFINGKRVDVIAEGELIDQGASIEVVAVQGMRVVVREM